MRDREEIRDGREQNRAEPPGWSRILRQTGPEVFESGPGEGEPRKSSSKLLTWVTVIGGSMQQNGPGFVCHPFLGHILHL